jgi:predicted ATP-grasp superfamily ATP-dependent carboligase
MRILVHEFVSGGGLAGADVPASLVREGVAMRRALVEDLVALGCHDVVTTIDPRFPLSAPRAVDVIPLAAGSRRLDPLIASVDAVWFIAPETNGWLERLARRVERAGTVLLGSCAAAIQVAGDKRLLPLRLAEHGIRHPRTRVLSRGTDALTAARQIGYPVIAKPARGAGCEGVRLAFNARQLREALADDASSDGPVVLQEYVRGAAASVSLLVGGGRVLPLTLNAQHVRRSRRLSYAGGQTPFDHPLAAAAAEAARRTCEAVPGLRGYIGVDLVLTEREAVVIEVNPRLTTAYLGVRAAIKENVAELAIRACIGTLPEPPHVTRHVRFSARGRILSARPFLCDSVARRIRQ